MSLTYTHRIVIKPAHIELNGKIVSPDCVGENMLTELYRKHINDYPKFFKMDMLCRLGFVASELLLKEEGAHLHDCDDRAIVFFNREASIHNDKNYQQTIGKDNYFPSPALFVYTLPNIVTGEIAIRNKYYGESAFYVLESPDFEMIEKILDCCFADNNTRSIMGGWLEYSSPNDFCADLRIYKKL